MVKKMDDIKQVLLNNFLKISSISRKSDHEKKIAAFFVDVAKEKNLYYFKDVVITVDDKFDEEIL